MQETLKNSRINFALNSVFLTLTIVKRAVLGKHSAKHTAYLFRRVFLHEKLHQKKQRSRSLWRRHLVFVVSPSEDGLLQGAVAEQASEHPCRDEAGIEDGEGRGLLTTGAAHPMVRGRGPGPKSVQWPAKTRYGLRAPRAASLWDFQPHSERALAGLKAVIL